MVIPMMARRRFLQGCVLAVYAWVYLLIVRVEVWVLIV